MLRRAPRSSAPMCTFAAMRAFAPSRALFPMLSAAALVFGAGPGVACASGQAERLDLTALGRPADEVARDVTSKPLEVYEFLGIRGGSVVADLIAGGGYNTAVLTHAVGDEGVVFSQAGRRGGLAERATGGDLKGRRNVVVFQEVEELPADSLDVALTVRNYHDVPPKETRSWLAAIRAALVPGGVLGIVDVRTKPGFEGRATDLHRISEDLIVEEVTATGFELEGRSDLLANPKDSYESSEFENRETTDRMLLKFRKPKADPAKSERG